MLLLFDSDSSSDRDSECDDSYSDSECDRASGDNCDDFVVIVTIVTHKRVSPPISYNSMHAPLTYLAPVWPPRLPHSFLGCSSDPIRRVAFSPYRPSTARTTRALKLSCETRRSSRMRRTAVAEES